MLLMPRALAPIPPAALRRYAPHVFARAALRYAMLYAMAPMMLLASRHYALLSITACRRRYATLPLISIRHADIFATMIQRAHGAAMPLRFDIRYAAFAEPPI